ncbi:pentatricopeptide repeat-containing protein At5g50390, chloroplastic [Dendrobium catenatum]|uniref:Pentatricopeptide repeat-containing protein n=1 Tax=Dendrobium catenatum TaxID=906689 RepID=A0A2I0WMP5_9ASPA|nr:pentatricopeptide repeat-containing protein At5g50390, chloroplastic [Dendrobium catenatum]PKU76918.1 Pentatricopeptide repeat-containing protein [Dendrobium catenatum]
MDAILFLPWNLPSRGSLKLSSSPFHSLLATSEGYNDKKTNSFDPSIRGCNSLLYNERKISYFIVRCSSMEQGLKARPMRKLMPVTDSPDLERGSNESNSTQITQAHPSALCHQIERLVFLKKYKEAIELFEILEVGGKGSVRFEAIGTSTYDSLVTACISLKSATVARFIFRHMIESEFNFDQYMMNRVLLMHLKCGMIMHARRLFDEMPHKNLVSWNTIISGLVDAGSYDEALEMFLIIWEDLSDVGSRGLATAIRAVAGLASVAAGSQLHSLAFKIGLYDNLFVSCALINMYGKCGCIDEARMVFDAMPDKHVVGWNSIIAGYALSGYSEEALKVYYEMQNSNVKMDHFTYSIIIRICARLGSLEQGKQAHAGLVRNGFGMDTVACTALVDLYCKWGRMDDARNVFDKMSRKNLVSWNALIGGYGNHGMGVEAVAMFESMVKEGIVPNHVTFLAVLGACSYSGMLSKGREIFELMAHDPKMKPRAMHYACMIELLGREGLLDDALALIRNAPLSPTKNMWAALFRACRVHRNLELGKLAAEKLLGMEPEKLGNYIVLLNLYNSSGRMNDAAKVLDSLVRKGLRLVPACSWIEIKKEPHRFLFGDNSHPQSKEIYKRLDALMQEIVKEGYLPQRRCLFPDVVEHDQIILGYHSEILAITFGLLNTPESTPLQVLQSHRVCDDCHCVIKLVSIVTRREIVVRDASRFHHFKNGACSCAEYW